jgi:hypothetical protein
VRLITGLRRRAPIRRSKSIAKLTGGSHVLYPSGMAVICGGQLGYRSRNEQGADGSQDSLLHCYVLTNSFADNEADL